MAKQQNNPFSEFFTQNFSNNDFAKFFESFQDAPFDTKALIETQQKNLQAISAAQQAAFEGFQSIAQRQAEIISQNCTGKFSNRQRSPVRRHAGRKKSQKNADLFKTAYERSIENLQEISDLVNTSNQNATKILNKRVTDSVNELKAAVKTPANKNAA